jgi:hypothetical protein
MKAFDFFKAKLLHGPLRRHVYDFRVFLNRHRHLSVQAVDDHLLQKLQADGGFVSTLDALNLASSQRMFVAARAAAATMPDAQSLKAEGDKLLGRNTSLHCFSMDPPELVAHESAIVLWGLEERLLDLAEAYFGLPPALTAVHLRKDIGTGEQVGTRFWHLDTEDEKVLRLIVYLDDVTINDGPFEYITLKDTASVKSIHRRAKRSAGDPIFDEEMKKHVPEARWKTCTGPAGTVAIADNGLCFHHGRVHNSQRLIMIYTYTSRNPHYPKLVRNGAFDAKLSPRQRECFFVQTR